MHAKLQIGDIVVSISLLLSLIFKFRPFGYPQKNMLLLSVLSALTLTVEVIIFF